MRKDTASAETSNMLLVTNEDIVFLRDNWKNLTSRCTDDCGQAEAVFAMLCKMYSAKNRFYHNLHHIAEMIRLIDSHRDSIADIDTLYFATWFHDAVYNAKSTSNEEKSSALALKELTKL